MVPAPARGMPLVERGLVRGAHGDRALQLAAEPRPVAHLDRVLEPILVLVGEEGLGGRNVRRRPAGRDAQVLDRHSLAREVDLDPGVHEALRVPDRLDRSERAADGLPEVAKLQRGARTARPVFAAQRATVTHDEVRDLLADLHHPLPVSRVAERQHWTDVEAADAGMRVEAGTRAVARQDLLELADEPGELRWVDRGVLHEAERLADARHAVQERLAGLPQLPGLGHPAGVHVLLHGLAGKARAEVGELGVDLVRGLSEVLDVHHGAQLRSRGARHQLDVGRVLAVLPREVDDDVVDEFHRGGLRRDHGREGGKRLVHAGEPHDGQSLRLGRRHQRDLRSNHGAERAFGTAHDVREVHAVERARRRALQAVEEEVEVVAVDVPQDAREARANLVAQRHQHVAHRLGDRALARVAVARPLLEPVHAAVGEHDVHGVEVLDRAAEHDAAHPGRVVADGAADRVVTRGRGVGSEEQAVRSEVQVQAIDHHPGLDPRATARRIDRDHPAAVRSEVDHHRGIHGLPVEAGAAPAGQHRDAMGRAPLHHADGLGDVARHHRQDRVDLVDAGIGGVEQPLGPFGTDVRTAERGERTGDPGARLARGCVVLRQRDHCHGMLTCRRRAPSRPRPSACRPSSGRSRCGWTRACRRAR